MYARGSVRLWHDRATPFGVHREDAVVSHERIPRRRHQRGQPRQELDRRHHAVRAATACVLHAVRDAAVAEHAEAFESKARTSAVADEALATFVIVGFNAHRGLEVETVAFGGERTSLPRFEALAFALGPPLGPAEGARLQVGRFCESGDESFARTVSFRIRRDDLPALRSLK